MSNRWFRFVIALLAIGAAGAAGFRIYQQDQRLTSDRANALATGAAAESGIVAVADTRAALHAYVAEGQGLAFWTARATAAIDELRAALLALETPAAEAGVTLTDTLDLTDRLAAAEKRAREHVASGQMLLAGDVIFTEAGELLDTLRGGIISTRAAILEGANSRHAAARRELNYLTAGALGVLALATLLLVVPGGAAAEVRPTSIAPASVVEDDSSARVVSRVPLAPDAAAAPARATAAAKPAARGAATPPAAAATAAAAAKATSAKPASTVSLRDAALVCTELGRASQTVEVTALLARAATVLDASGVVVWMAVPGGHELFPAASAGYDERLLERIGSIRRDASNVTAAAFRDGSPRTSASKDSSAAALAIPMLTPLGPAGVLSAELRESAEVDETRLAVATIFAAQLASLLGSMTTTERAAPRAAPPRPVSPPGLTRARR